VNSRERAARLADDLLLPAALEVDRADRVPGSHFEALAREGLYDFDGDLRTVEALASGCLTTAFVWLQHHGPLTSTAASHPDLHAALASGRLKGGIARAGARPGNRSLAASSKVNGGDGVNGGDRVDGYVLNGSVPWVTGWGMIDIVEVAALDENDNVVFLLVDATDSPTLTSKVNQLSAANASRTATLTFTDHHVPADRLTRKQPFADWQAAQASGSRLNGGLALGVASRCVRLLGAETTPPYERQLRSELETCRRALLDADESALPLARAAASELAIRAALTLTIQTGSRSVLVEGHAQRLVREAAFLLVFGTREKIKAELLRTVPLGPRPDQLLDLDGPDR
jgi:hypothetical protein